LKANDPNISIRLTICLNDHPIGARIRRGEELPQFKHTYSNTPDGKKQAEYDMEQIRAYIIRNNKVKLKK